MKQVKKLTVWLIVLALTVLTVLPVSAIGKITINDGAEKTYRGYLLMTSTDDGQGHYAYVLNPVYAEAVLNALGTGRDDMTDAELAGEIGKLDADGIRTFADAVYRSVKDKDPDAEFVGGSETEAEQGYWLIAETTEVDGEENEVRSLVILDTAGSEAVTLEPKKELPTVEKEVEKTTACVGEVILFTLTGTTANYSDSYETYSYAFKDTMKAMKYIENSAEITVSDGRATSGDFTVTYDEQTGLLTVAAADLKGKITPDTVITVTYQAKITAEAITEKAENEVVIEYSNDPYHGGTGTGTPEKVTVDVVNITVDKYEKGDTSKKLSGAKFTLQNEAGEYYHWDEEAEEVVWSAVYSEAEHLTVTDKNGTASFGGLAVGEYTLTEKEAPDGYNLLTEPVQIRVDTTADGEYSSTTDGVTVIGNTAEVGIANSTGTELPETGGIGTVIFTTTGMIAALTAGIFLVTNKRMKKEGI